MQHFLRMVGIWNKLLEEVVEPCVLSIFKRHLDIHRIDLEGCEPGMGKWDNWMVHLVHAEVGYRAWTRWVTGPASMLYD